VIKGSAATRRGSASWTTATRSSRTPRASRSRRGAAGRRGVARGHARAPGVDSPRDEGPLHRRRRDPRPDPGARGCRRSSGGPAGGRPTWWTSIAGTSTGGLLACGLTRPARAGGRCTRRSSSRRST
jgi:hypothetical protein